MATATFDPGRDTLRWFTRARRIPRLVGKLPGMERGLPFGPYTMTQAIGGSVTGVVLLKTEPLWGAFGWLTNKVVILAVTVGVTFLLRLVKPGGRDPVSAFSSLLRVGMASRHGTLRGRDLRPGKPVHVRARVRVSWPAPARAASLSPQAELAPAPVELADLLGLQPAPEAASASPARPSAAPPATAAVQPTPAGPLRAPTPTRRVRPVPSLAGALPPRTALERLLVTAQSQEV